MRPPQAVDDVTVLGPQLYRFLDHLQTALQILALVDPGISEIVEHQRLFGLEFEGMQEVSLRQLPLTGAFERDTATVVQRPALRHASRLEAPDRLVIGFDRFAKALLTAQQIAELHLGASPRRRFRRHLLELSDRLLSAVEHLEIGSDAQSRRP